MGWVARANPRSRNGGKPAAYVALHRLWRGVDHFQGDHRQFEDWMSRTMVSDAQRERLEW